MDLPTIDEIRKSFPNQIPENVTSVVFLEAQPDADLLYKENSMIEWIGYLKGKVIGIKKFLFGSAGLIQVIVTSAALFAMLTSDKTKQNWDALTNYSIQKVAYAEDLVAQYITFGVLPNHIPNPEDEAPDAPITFKHNLATVPVSGHYTGLS
jgi:hypothetical protein